MADLEAFSGLDSELKLDSSSGQPSYLVVGNSGTHIRLSASAYNLLQAARSGLSWDAVAEAMGRQSGHRVDAADLEASYDRVAERLAEIDGRPATEQLPPGFWLRWRLLSQPTVGRIAARLAGLFALTPALILSSIIGSVLCHAVIQSPSLSFDNSVFWPAYLLFTVSLIAHELGHVSACRRFGARPNDIGFTVYWIFPAFYSDVTTAWQLERKHRVIVDLGGVFFQLALGSLFWLIYLATDWSAFKAAFFMILYGCLFSLNPVFKFDGYWMLADALGVTHLSQQPTRILRYLSDRSRGRSTEALPWPPWITAALILYAPLCFGFWLYFSWKLLPNVWQRALAYPNQIFNILADLAAFQPPDSSTVQTVCISTFLLLVTGLMLRHLGNRVLQAVRRGRMAPDASKQP